MKDSLKIAKQLNITHYSLSKMIVKYEELFEIFGEIKTKRIEIKKGRPIILKYLNEDQVDLLTILLKNTENNIKLKINFLKRIKNL